MRYPQFTNSIEFRSPPPAYRKYVLEVRQDRTCGRLYVEVCARGKAPTWREVPYGGPSWRGVIDGSRIVDAIGDLALKPEPSAMQLRANGLAAGVRRKYGLGIG